MAEWPARGASPASDRSAKAAGGYPSPLTGWSVVGILLCGYIVAYLDRQIIVLLAPQLSGDLGLNDTQIGMVQGLAFALFFAIAGLPIGSLADRFNRRNILIAGIVLWSGATIACGFARDFTELFLARLAVGAGEACLAPAGFSIVADMFPSTRRGRAIGVILAGSAIGVGASSLLGGLLIEALTANGGATLPLVGWMAPWRAVFILAGLPGFAVVAALLCVREPRRRESEAPAGPVESEAEPPATGESFGPAAQPRRMIVAAVLLMFGLNQLIGYGMISWGPLVLIRVHAMSVGEVGVILGGLVLAINIFPHPIGGFLADKLAVRFPGTGRLLLAFVTLPPTLACLFLLLAPSPAAGIASYIAVSFITGILNGASYSAVQELVPVAQRARIVAAYVLTATLLGSGLAPPLIGFATDAVFADPQMVAYSIVMVTSVAAVLALLCAAVAVRELGPRAVQQRDQPPSSRA